MRKRKADADCVLVHLGSFMDRIGKTSQAMQGPGELSSACWLAEPSLAVLARYVSFWGQHIHMVWTGGGYQSGSNACFVLMVRFYGIFLQLPRATNSIAIFTIGAMPGLAWLFANPVHR
jgi:hypothetical protein